MNLSLFKVCFKCEKTFPLYAFYKHAMMADGHLNKCKSCTKKDTIQNRTANLSYYIEYDRSRANLPHRAEARKEYIKTPKGREIDRKSKAKWNAKNPHKRKAQRLVATAVQGGRLERKPCEKCGNRAQAHHDDYSKPLDVRWLCPKHHAEYHKAIRRAA